MRSGCRNIIGLVVAIGCGVLAASPAEAGFSSVSPPHQFHSDVRRGSSDFGDAITRFDAPEASTSRQSSYAALAVDLPDCTEFRDGTAFRGGAREGSPGPRPSIMPRKGGYSHFWESAGKPRPDAEHHDLGADVTAAAPVVVPLPPAVWTGLITLAGGAYVQYRRRRRRLRS